MSPYVLALDPTIANTGWSVWKVKNKKWSMVECGLVATKSESAKRKIFSGDDTTRRWEEILDELIRLHEKYSFSALVSEITPGGVQNATAAKSLFGAQALVIAFAKVSGIPKMFVKPKDIKLALCQNGTASKDDMMYQAHKLTGGAKNFINKSTGNILKKFEHPADSIGAFYAVKNHDIIKMMEQACES